MQIEFSDAQNLLPGERNSKLLRPDSPLVLRLQAMRDSLCKTFGADLIRADRPWHIEVNRSHKPRYGAAASLSPRLEQARKDAVRARAMSLHGQTVDLDNRHSFSLMGRAFVLLTPAVEAYGPTHVTIAYFPAGVPADIDTILSIALQMK